MSAPLTAMQLLVRADDARQDADAVSDPQAKRMMLAMAAGYERLAVHAMALERSGLPHEGDARTSTTNCIWRGCGGESWPWGRYDNGRSE